MATSRWASRSAGLLRQLRLEHWLRPSNAARPPTLLSPIPPTIPWQTAESLLCAHSRAYSSPGRVNRRIAAPARLGLHGVTHKAGLPRSGVVCSRSAQGTGDDHDVHTEAPMREPLCLVDAGLRDAFDRGWLAHARLDVRIVDIGTHAPWGATCREPAIIVLSATDRFGSTTADFVRPIRQRTPSATIIAASTTLLNGRQRRLLADAGADWCIALTRPRAFDRVQVLAARRALASAPHRALLFLYLAETRMQDVRLPAWIIRNACYRPSVEDAAGMFGVTARTIGRSLSRAGHPPYGALKGLGILLHGLQLEVSFGLRRRHAAQRLGFTDASTLSRLARKWRSAAPETPMDPWTCMVALYEKDVRSSQRVSSFGLAETAHALEMIPST